MTIFHFVLAFCAVLQSPRVVGLPCIIFQFGYQLKTMDVALVHRRTCSPFHPPSDLRHPRAQETVRPCLAMFSSNLLKIENMG